MDYGDHLALLHHPVAEWFSVRFSKIERSLPVSNTHRLAAGKHHRRRLQGTHDRFAQDFTRARGGAINPTGPVSPAQESQRDGCHHWQRNSAAMIRVLQL